MKLVRFAIAFVLVLPLSAIARAASFDCARASTSTEKTICSDKEISSFDDQVYASYKAVLARSTADSAERVRRSQRVWLKERNTCSDVPCLKEMYRSRLTSLASIPNGTDEKPSLSRILLVLPPMDDSPRDDPTNAKLTPVELTGIIESASYGGGCVGYGVEVDEKFFMMRCATDISDEANDSLDELSKSRRKVTVKGTLVTQTDGYRKFSEHAEIGIY